MKKCICMILSALMILSLTAAAFNTEGSAPQGEQSEEVTEPTPMAAEKSVDQRLAAVAAKVKATLNISDEYEEFTGDLWENELAPRWSLNWNRESDSISVEAFENGQISNYYFYENDESYRSVRDFPPAFPTITRKQAQQYAQKFLKNVLDSSETVTFSERSTGRLNTETHRFSGTILINGLESPLSFSISVRASDGKIVRFYRDCREDSYIGSIPSPTPGAASDKAGTLLKGTLSLRTEYVLENDKAVLRFLPDSSDEYFVDAQTGKLVNLTELYKLVSKGEENGANSSAQFDLATPEAAADTGGSGLTQVELEGISKLEGVLSKEALDKKMRDISYLGLDKYTLAASSYSRNQKTDEVTARLSYTRRDGDDSWRRTITCNAKTGDLQGIWSSSPYNKDRTASVSEGKARETAEAFLAEFWSKNYSRTELYHSTPWEDKNWDASHSFTYAQKENGFFFPGNCINVSVDIEDGSISGFSRNWTDISNFESPEGIMSESSALDAWFNHYDLQLGYGRIPVKLDSSMEDAVPLLDKGYSYFYSMQLTYTLTEPDDVRAAGMNAKTGEIITENWYKDDNLITYSDLDNYAGKDKLATLAEYGIGWTGGKCEPNKKMSQLDLVALLVSADGYQYDPETGDAGDMYRRAYGLGILSASERSDSKLLTRGETVRMLLNCAGYGDVAKLPGIFSCSYPDAAQIPANLLGYAAIAQGLGVVDVELEFGAGKTATRGEAAEMLFNFMSR